MLAKFLRLCAWQALGFHLLLSVPLVLVLFLFSLNDISLVIPCREENASILRLNEMFLLYFSLWDSGVSPLWHKMMGDGSQTSIALGQYCGPGICGICPSWHLSLPSLRGRLFFFSDEVATWPPQGHHGNCQSK